MRLWIYDRDGDGVTIERTDDGSLVMVYVDNRTVEQGTYATDGDEPFRVATPTDILAVLTGRDA